MQSTTVDRRACWELYLTVRSGMRTRGCLPSTLRTCRRLGGACLLDAGERRASRDARLRHTSIARCLQQQQDLLIIEMFQSINVVDDLRSEETMAGVTRRRGDALGDAAQGRGALETTTRSFERVAWLGGVELVELRLVGVHVIEMRALKPISCRKLVVHGPCWARSAVLSLRKGGGSARNGSVREGATLLFDGWKGTSSDPRPSGRH